MGGGWGEKFLIIRCESFSKDKFFKDFSTSPQGECWKTSAALNSKIDNRSSSVSAGVHSPELIAGDESEVPLTQILQGVESVCGSNAADSMALDAMICSGSKVVAAT